MTIYTGYFAQLKKYQELGLTPVSIARYSPSWFTGYCLKELAPSDSLLKGYKDGVITVEEYRKQYLQHLETVRWTEVLRRLEKYAPDGAVLCCYEKPNDFCHRHILSEYMRESGYEVMEILVTKGKPPKVIGGSVLGVSS